MILSTRRLFTAIFFIALFVLTVRPVSDPDFWWHLRTGQYILSTSAVPHADVFSATNAGRPWVAHEWLSELIIYLLYAAGSSPALIVAFSAITTLAFVLVYACCDGKPYIAAAAALFAAMASAPTWGVRPQMLSLLMTCLFLWVLNRWEHGNQRLVWALVPLMLVWVNLHSGFAVGLAILAVYLAGHAVSRLAAPGSRGSSSSWHEPDGAAASPEFRAHAWRDLAPRIRSSPLASLAVVSAACLLVVPLNPNGVTMYVYPFETLTSHAMQTYIQEWFSPDFHQLQFQPFAWLLLATLAAVGLSGKRITLTQTLLLALFGYAGLESARNIPLFAVIAAPGLAEHLWHIVDSRGWARWLAPSRAAPTRLVALNWVLLVVIAAAAIALDRGGCRRPKCVGARRVSGGGGRFPCRTARQRNCLQYVRLGRLSDLEALSQRASIH